MDDATSRRQASSAGPSPARAGAPVDVRPSPHAAAVASMAAAAIVWGGAVGITKLALTDVPPLTLAFLRFAAASLLLVAFERRRSDAPSLRSLPWRQLAVLGLTGVALFFALINSGLALTTASDTALISGAMPAAAAAAGWLFLRQRLDAIGLLALALSVAGAAIVATAQAPGPELPGRLVGNLLVAGSVASWALYTVAGGRLQSVPPLTAVTWSGALGALFLAPVAALELFGGARITLTVPALLAFVYLTLGASCVAYLLWNRGVRVVSAFESGVVVNLIPVAGVAAAVLLVGERLEPRQLVGGALILAGVLLVAARRRAG
ncbi:MAG TPA: EamA family transporter [Candidatus Limnocylindrales bacterium]|nr:EamA family transporter [Candidatus Limnocylindrales bacterium]